MKCLLALVNSTMAFRFSSWGIRTRTLGTISTCSSLITWEIGWSSVLALKGKMRLTKIKHYQQFNVNIPDNLMLRWSRLAYQPSGELEHLGLDYEISERTQAPDFRSLSSRLVARWIRIIEEDGICHILPNWLLKLLDDKGI